MITSLMWSVKKQKSAFTVFSSFKDEKENSYHLLFKG